MIQSSITPIPSSSGAGGGGGSGGSTSTSPTPASTPSVVAAPVLLKKSGPAAPTPAAPPSPNLPRTSSLTQQEHRLFLDLERRFVQHQQQQVDCVRAVRVVCRACRVVSCVSCDVGMRANVLTRCEWMCAGTAAGRGESE
jgi:hypothetical protein